MNRNPGSPTPFNAIILLTFYPLVSKCSRPLLLVGRISRSGVCLCQGVPTLYLVPLICGICPRRPWYAASQIRSRTCNNQAVMCLGALSNREGCSTDRHTSLSAQRLGSAPPLKTVAQGQHQKPVRSLRFCNLDRTFRLDECLVAILSWISVGSSCAIGRSSPEITGAIRRGVTLILPGIAAVHAIGAARAAVVTSIIALTQTVYQARKFLLHDHDTLLNDGVWLQVTGTLNLEVELLRHGVVLEDLARLGRFLKRGILALRPVLLSILREQPHILAKTYHSCSGLAPSSLPSNHRSVCPSLLCGSYSNPTAAVGAHFACSFAIPFFAMHVNFSS